MSLLTNAIKKVTPVVRNKMFYKRFGKSIAFEVAMGDCNMNLLEPTEVSDGIKWIETIHSTKLALQKVVQKQGLRSTLRVGVSDSTAQYPQYSSVARITGKLYCKRHDDLSAIDAMIAGIRGIKTEDVSVSAVEEIPYDISPNCELRDKLPFNKYEYRVDLSAPIRYDDKTRNSVNSTLRGLIDADEARVVGINHHSIDDDVELDRALGSLLGGWDNIKFYITNEEELALFNLKFGQIVENVIKYEIKKDA